ncbi:MAG: methyltransferase domain-containing protein [Tunicatimonas sp.]
MKWIIRWATRHIPRKYLQLFSHQVLSALAFFYRGKRVYCPVDGRSYRKFLPYGRVHPRPNALCPGSLTLERHRLLWLYLQEKTNFFDKPIRLLHVAPEICFVERFERLSHIDYISADLDSPWAQVKMDLHDIPFADNSFDVVLCNHVMEHVRDDIQCMREILRVLKPGGWAIIQSPTYDLETTYEDPSIIDPKERERAYGQDDHLRRYGHDYGDRLRQAGFVVTEDDYVKHFSGEKIRYYALLPEELIYFCEKKARNTVSAGEETEQVGAVEK